LRVVSAAALLKQGGCSPGNQLPEPIGGGNDADQRADRNEAHGAKHNQDARHGSHAAPNSCSCPSTPNAFASTWMIISAAPHQLAGDLRTGARGAIVKT
jgi:hypothetical protein